MLFEERSSVGGSRVATTLMPFFSGDLVEVAALCMADASLLWGGWVGQAYIISLAPHPGGQQQKVPFTTKVRRTSVPARFFTPTPPPTPTPTPPPPPPTTMYYYYHHYY